MHKTRDMYYGWDEWVNGRADGDGLLGSIAKRLQKRIIQSM